MGDIDTPKRGLLTTSDDVAGILPGDYGKLVIEPVQQASIAMQVGQLIPTASNTFHIPVIREDATASWIAEGEDAEISDAKFEEIVVTPSKVVGFSVVSRELAKDSSPAATEAVGHSLARSIAKSVDAAFFGDEEEPAPSGLEAMEGATVIYAGATLTDLDWAVEGALNAAGKGTFVGAWVANEDTAKAIASLKEGNDSNRGLIEPDPKVAGRYQIQGAPLLVSSAIAENTVWGIPKTAAIVVLREDVQVDTDTSLFFQSDRVAVRALARVGFAFPVPSQVQKVLIEAAPVAP